METRKHQNAAIAVDRRLQAKALRILEPLERAKVKVIIQDDVVIFRFPGGLEGIDAEVQLERVEE